MKFSISFILCTILIFNSCEEFYPFPEKLTTLPVCEGDQIIVQTDTTIYIQSKFSNFTKLAEGQDIIEIGHYWDTVDIFSIPAYNKAISADDIYSLPNRNAAISGENLTNSDTKIFVSIIPCQHLTTYYIVWYILMNDNDIIYDQYPSTFKNVLRIPYFRETYISTATATQTGEPYLHIRCEIYNLYQLSLTHTLNEKGFCWNEGIEIPTIESNIIAKPFYNPGIRYSWDDKEDIYVTKSVEDNMTYTFCPYVIIDGDRVFYGDPISYTYNGN